MYGWEELTEEVPEDEEGFKQWRADVREDMDEQLRKDFKRKMALERYKVAGDC